MPSLTLRKPSPALAAVAAFVERGDSTDTAPAPAAAIMPAATPVTIAPAIPATPSISTTSSQPVDAPSFTRARRSVADRRTKPPSRRTTVYFDLDVARDLATRVEATDEEMSAVVNAAVRAYLSPAG